MSLEIGISLSIGGMTTDKLSAGPPPGSPYAIATAPNNPATGATGTGQLTDMRSGGYSFGCNITNDLTTDISNIQGSLSPWAFLGVSYTIDTSPGGNLRITNNYTNGNRNFALWQKYTNYGFIEWDFTPATEYGPTA